MLQPDMASFIISKIKSSLSRCLITALAATAITSCDDCCCGGCCCCGGDDDDSGEGKWYHTEIDATYDNQWFIPVTPRTDWLEHWPENIGLTPQSLEHPLPDGLRVVAFTSVGGVRDHNIPTHGGEVPVNSLTTHMLFFNNDTEYIVIENQDSFSEATATTRRRNSGAYTGNREVGSDIDNEPVRSQPDMLFRAALSETPVDSLLAEAETTPADIHTISVRLVPAVYVYVVHFSFDKGIEHVLNASAAITGLSSGVNLSTGHTLDQRCTVMFDCPKDGEGLTGTFMSFGAPDYAPGSEHNAGAGRYGITLQTLLTNGKRKSFTADITPQMSLQPSGGIVMISNLEISDEESKPDSGGGGSFDVDVDPWGEPNDYEIIL